MSKPARQTKRPRARLLGTTSPCKEGPGPTFGVLTHKSPTKKGQPVSSPVGLMVQVATDSRQFHPGLCVPCKVETVLVLNYRAAAVCCAAAEPGRRNGRRARSSTADMLRFAIATTGWPLSATRSTATAQLFCNIYRLAIASPKTAKTAANNAKAASNSLTKYSCSAPIIPRNHHNHFLPLSLFFIPLASDTPCLFPEQLRRSIPLCLPLSRRASSGAPTCPFVSVTALPVPFDRNASANAMVHKVHFRT